MPMYIGPDNQALKITDVDIGYVELPDGVGVKRAIALDWRRHKLLMSKKELIEIQKMLARGLEILTKEED